MQEEGLEAGKCKSVVPPAASWRVEGEWAQAEEAELEGWAYFIATCAAATDATPRE